MSFQQCFVENSVECVDNIPFHGTFTQECLCILNDWGMLTIREYFLVSKTLAFSHWAPSDLSFAVSLWGNASVTKFIDLRPHLSAQEAAKKLSVEMDRMEEHGVQYYPLFLLEGDTFIGCCGLRPGHSPNTLELGIHLLPDYWGKGIAKEACSAVIQYAFDHLMTETIFAGHHPDNLASAALLNSLGFTSVGLEYYPPTGLMHPSYILQLINLKTSL